MKKYIYIALAAAAFASCSQDEALMLNQEEIQFGNPFVENATRAASDASYSGSGILSSFQVWGTVKSNNNNDVAIFADDAVIGSVGSGSVWTCDKTQYWIYGAKYNFAAVVNADKNNENKSDVKLGTNQLPAIITYTADDTNMKDLVYAEAKNISRAATDTDKKVQMTFKHLLSKVKFTAVNTTNNTDYTFNIKDITITNSPSKGTYYAQEVTENNVKTSAETWVVASYGTTTFGDIKDVEYVTNNTKYECGAEKLLIPANYKENNKLTVSYTLEWCYNDNVITSESGKTASAIVKLQAGYAYNFVISTGLNEPIQFTVESNPSWTSATGGDITLQ